VGAAFGFAPRGGCVHLAIRIDCHACCNSTGQDRPARDRRAGNRPARDRRAGNRPTGACHAGDRHAGDAFLAWQRYSQDTPRFHVGGIVNGGCATDLAPEIVAAYDAPFPDESYKEGARQFPMLVPTTPDDPASEANRRAWKVFEQWDKPFLTAFSDSDPITSGAEKVFQSVVPGAHGRTHPTIAGGGHFLQEDKGEDLAAVIVDFVRAT